MINIRNSNMVEFELACKPSTSAKPRETSPSEKHASKETHRSSKVNEPTAGSSEKRGKRRTRSKSQILKGIEDFDDQKQQKSRNTFMIFQSSNENLFRRLHDVLNKNRIVRKWIIASDSAVDQKFVFAYVVLNKLVLPEKFSGEIENETGSKCRVMKVSNKRALFNSIASNGFPICHRHNMDDQLQDDSQSFTEKSAVKKVSPPQNGKRQKTASKVKTTRPLTAKNLAFLRTVMSAEEIAMLKPATTSQLSAMINKQVPGEETMEFSSKEEELQTLIVERDRAGTMVNTLENEVRILEQQLRNKKDELKKTKSNLEALKTNCLTLARGLKENLKENINELRRKEQLQRERLDSIRLMADDDSQLGI